MEDKVDKIVALLMHSRNQTHIYHLQTSSFAKHKALQEYYDSIVDLIDSLAETYQGKYGVIKSITVPKSIKSLTSEDDPSRYLKRVASYVEDNRQTPSDGELQNIFDEILALLSKTFYLLDTLE
jgi:DNA-binding ferritin-like protein